MSITWGGTLNYWTGVDGVTLFTPIKCSWLAAALPLAPWYKDLSCLGLPMLQEVQQHHVSAADPHGRSVAWPTSHVK